MNKVLIVDDDPMVRQLVKIALSGTYECVEAPDGETALDLVETERPDAIVLDWVLPGLSGLNVVKRLKHYPEYRDIPIIIISARGEEQTRAAAEDVGTAHLAKPFDVDELHALLARALERK
jgi:two-component system, OmpR family, phosphate regulon response regulator PhoB